MPFPYNASGIDASGGFTPAPEGVYMLKIVDAAEKTSKKGNPMVSVRCQIDDANEWLGTTVWHNVTFLPKDAKGAGMAVQFLAAIGEPHEGEFEVDAFNWKGKSFRAKLKIEKDLQGRNRNQIAYLVSDEAAADEVPF